MWTIPALLLSPLLWWRRVVRRLLCENSSIVLPQERLQAMWRGLGIICRDSLESADCCWLVSTHRSYVMVRPAMAEVRYASAGDPFVSIVV